MPKLDREHVLQLFEYHHWAADRVYESLAAVTAEQLDKPWGGSFSTGRALLRHVIGVERLWTDRWNGSATKGLPEYPASHGGTDFRDEWERIKPDQQRYLGGLSKNKLDGDLVYSNTKGERWSYPLSHVLIHVVNHGTYHRGQLTHFLRDQGMSAPSTDFLYFGDAGRQL
jgi:uncharacterized damage-inducible protein DinB